MADFTSPTSPREPAFNIPAVVVVCCVVLIGIHAARMVLAPDTDDAILALFAFVPARMAIALGVAQQALQLAVQNMPQETFRLLIGAGGGRWWSLVTYALLHGSWAHVGFNCVWLVAFGAPVARRLRAMRFLLLLFVAAMAGALVQFAAAAASFVPVIGASAAVAGAMGAATRFVFRPADDPRQIFDRTLRRAAVRPPALTLRQTFATKGTLTFVIFWFATNLLFGLVPALSGVGNAPIAWPAHIGGFFAGLLLFPLFDPPPPPGRAFDSEDSADLPTDESV